MRNLYPIKFESLSLEKVWGKENFIISDLGLIDSVAKNGWLEGNSIGDIMETYLESIVGDGIFQRYGRQLPIQIKILEIKDRLSLQINPDDEIAAERYDSLGKSKLWYIMEASEDAKIYLGLKEKSDAQSMYEHCIKGSIEQKLNIIKPKKGDSFLIPAGTIHSTGGGLKIMEVAESSELNLRLYDWERAFDPEDPRGLHLEEAIDLINFKPYDPSLNLRPHNHDSLLVSIPEFNITKLVLSDTLHIYTENYNSFIVYSCIEGEASILIDNEEYSLSSGESILIPALMKDFFLSAKSTKPILLETYLKLEEKLDNYIDPDTEPFLEGEDYDGLEDEDSEEDE